MSKYTNELEALQLKINFLKCLGEFQNQPSPEVFNIIIMTIKLHQLILTIQQRYGISGQNLYSPEGILNSYQELKKNIFSQTVKDLQSHYDKFPIAVMRQFLDDRNDLLLLSNLQKRCQALFRLVEKFEADLKKRIEELTLRQNFSKCLFEFQVQRSEVFKVVVSLIKLGQLISAIQQSYGIREQDLYSLECKLEAHQQLKKIFFSQTIKDLQPNYDKFPAEFMKQLLANKDNPLLLPNLQKSRKLLVENIKNFEEVLKKSIHDLKSTQSWYSYIYYKGKKLVSFAYTHSLVHLGSMILPAMVNPFVPNQPKTQMTLKIAGIGLGALGVYYGGIYQLTQTLMINGFMGKLLAYWNVYRFDEEKAIVISRPKMEISPTAGMRMATAVLIMGEFVYLQQYPSYVSPYVDLVTNLGRLVGDIGITFLVEKILPAVSHYPRTLAEAQALQNRVTLLFLASLLGRELGARGGRAVLRHNMVNALRRNFELTEAMGDISNLRIGVQGSWYEAENKVDIEWSQGLSMTFYRTLCKIREDISLFECDTIQPIEQLRINAV